MYSIRSIKHLADGGRREQNQPCAYYSVTHCPPDSPAARRNLDRPGISIELVPGGRVLHLPTDADIVYVMNQKGDTTSTYEVPEAWGDPSEWPVYTPPTFDDDDTVEVGP